MKLSNRLGLPQAILNAIMNDPYDKGDCDYSATGLLKPPRISALTEKFKDQIEEDAEDCLYRLYGQLVHALLERGNDKDLSEKRFFAEFNGKKVSAQLDTLSMDGNGVLSDYKFTTAWKFKKNQPVDADFTAQLNIQAELLRRNGYTPKKLQIVGLIRDYSMSDKLRQQDSYPDNPFVIQPIEMWPSEKTVAFINMRIADHEAAKIELPECSPSERWAKPDEWAVVKGSRAVNGGIYLTEKAADERLHDTPGARKEFRPGKNTRCEMYCNVSQFCTQYHNLIKQKKEKAG